VEGQGEELGDWERCDRQIDQLKAGKCKHSDSYYNERPYLDFQHFHLTLFAPTSEKWDVSAESHGLFRELRVFRG
jgi:hypothetical protein